ncbi:MAG: type VII secretion protein EssC [Erysipelotrichaceae bacterium]
MGFIIRVYYENRLLEQTTPNINNRSIIMPFSYDASLGNDLLVPLEVFDGVWSIKGTDDLQLTFSGQNVVQKQLSDGCIFYIEDKRAKRTYTLICEASYENYTLFNKYVLESGKISIGSKDDNMIACFNRKLISGHHAILNVEKNRVVIEDNESANGVFVNGYKVDGHLELVFGDMVDILGLKIILLDGYIGINNNKMGVTVTGLAQRVASTDEVINANGVTTEKMYSRSPRQIDLIESETVEIESPPSMGRNKRQPLMYTIGPSITMIIPMVVGVIFTNYSISQSGSGSTNPMIFMGIITSVTAATIGAFWAVTNFTYQRKLEKEDSRNRNDKYRAYLLKMRKIIEDKQKNNRDTLNSMYPDLKSCVDWVVSMNRRIWERNINHADFLTIRLGIGEMENPNVIQVPKERFSLIDDDLMEEPRRIKEDLETLRNVPICISLLNHRLIGVISEDSDHAFSVARNMIMQISAFHSYTDVKIVYFFNEKNHSEVDFKWLPHFWSPDEKTRLLSSDKNGVSDILFFLSSVVRERLEASTEDGEEKKHIPHYVVFIADPELIEDEVNSKILLNATNNYGITTVLLYEKLDKLPNNCTVIIQNDNEYQGYYSLESKFKSFKNLKFDDIRHDDFKRYAKEMSNVRLKEAVAVGKIPSAISFLDMYKTTRIDDLKIYRRWLQNRTFESMKAIIGYRGGDAPVYLDIHEKYHGPHGLVAGTTGSGKSETLQTYILSLAINYHPHEVSFILIDYKGGGMANSFESLPHLAGIITNLGGNQTNRALASINSEIKRRQAIFSENKVKHIDEYIELYRSDKVSRAIPHLVIIADEFAELKKEQPEFVRALVSASRVGRSLGVHLILATQKPSGVVDDEIWGNSRFRICLRVQDKQDSNEMLKRTDAAYITSAGRGFFQVGNNEIFEEFQSGWSGAGYDPEVTFADTRNNLTNMINLWGKSEIIGSNTSVATKSGMKQLNEIVKYIGNVAEQNNIRKIDQIWLPPLPSKVYLSDIEADAREAHHRNTLSTILGLVDDPVNQRQMPYTFDFIESGNLIINGSSLSGKSTLLQTLIYALITKYSPQQVNLYIADFGSRIMKVFEKAPHVGGVVFEDEIEKTEKLNMLLVRELASRKMKFSKQGIGTYKEYAKRFDDVPAIVFAIDNYSSYIENLKNQEENLILLSREASSYGIYLVFTVTNLNDIRNRIRQNFNMGIGLQLMDKFEYEAIINEKIELLADDRTPGRGIVKADRPLEFQSAICLQEDFSRLNEALGEALEEKFMTYDGVRAKRIPMIPSDLSYGNFRKSFPALIEDRTLLPIGYDVVEANPVELKLKDMFCLSVSGGAKTGKDNLVNLWVNVLSQRKERIVVFDRPEQVKTNSSIGHHIERQLTNDLELYDYLSTFLIPEIKRRGDVKVNYENDPSGDMTGYLDQMTPIYFIIRDMAYFLETVYKSQKDMKGFVENLFVSGRHYFMFFITIIDQNLMTGEYASYRALRNYISHKEGVHLGGYTDAQRIFDFELPSSERNKRLEPGFGHTVIEGKTIKVVTPRL